MLARAFNEFRENNGSGDVGWTVTSIRLWFGENFFLQRETLANLV
jgi:hypothetical protein